MRRFIIISIVIAIGFGSILIFYSRSLKSGSGLEFQPKVIDFGAVEASEAFSEPLHYVAHLRNFTGNNILIDKVDISCGCTLSDMAAGTIVPAHGDVPVHVSFSVNDHYGQLQSHISVFAEAIKKEQTYQSQVQVRVLSMKPAIVDPQSTIFPPFALGQPFPISSINVLHGNSRTILWDDIQVEANSIKIISKKANKDGITLEISPISDPCMLGSFNEPLLIYLIKDGKRISFPPISTNVIWEVASNLIAKSPSQVYLGLIHPGDPVSGKIIIRSLGNFKISHATASISNSAVADIDCHRTGDDLVEIDYKIKKSLPSGDVSCFIESQIGGGGLEFFLRTPVLGSVKEDGGMQGNGMQ